MMLVRTSLAKPSLVKPSLAKSSSLKSSLAKSCRRRDGDTTPIFQIDTRSTCKVNLDDVEEMQNICKGIPKNHAKDLYYSLGIDYDNAIRYFDIVKHLEKCYANSNKFCITLKYIGLLLAVFNITKQEFQHKTKTFKK